ncbi:MAG: sigma-54 dependent transcriptional regulator, partial [Bacteroidetes bacterium]|nr:sigma-54 dependent transcriptional regulator [Bacteroidota bacterium]
MKADILIVDDSLDMLEVLRRQLNSSGYSTFQASNVIDAIDLLKLNLPSLLITDIQMPGVDGMKLVRYTREKFPQLPILVITGYPSVDTAVDVMREGAVDYLVKPFTHEELENAITKVFNKKKNPPIFVKEVNSTPFLKTNTGIIGKSASLDTTFHLIERTKNTPVTVLITGESGTGKELVARAIHYGGSYKNKPFIAVNCGAIPENLLESELFGYEKGAFTGANESREGFFQAAEGGTIFLDEIGNASMVVQQRLLRVIQEKEVIKVGAQKSKKINVRILAATNNQLLSMVRNGSFREDLYYRLNVVNIDLPPLRNRKEDIPELVLHFVQKHGRELNKENLKVSDSALSMLCQYNWPGNIRELENQIHRALILADTSIETKHFPILSHSDIETEIPVNDRQSFVTLSQLERTYIF